MLSPFIVAPGLALVAVMAMAFHPSPTHFTLSWLATAAGVLAPWGLEIAGVLPRTMHVVDGELAIRAPALMLRLPQLEIGLAIYVVIILLVGALVVRHAARLQQGVQRRLQLELWQLRQVAHRRPSPSDL